jgi:hypothetical protein
LSSAAGITAEDLAGVAICTAMALWIWPEYGHRLDRGPVDFGDISVLLLTHDRAMVEAIAWNGGGPSQAGAFWGRALHIALAYQPDGGEG